MHTLSKLILAPIAALAVLSTPMLAPAQSPAPQKQESTITVNGTAKVYRTPDYVDIATAVEVQDKTASGAQSSASATMARIVAAIKDLKLPGQDLQTGSVDLSPRYDDHHRTPEETRRIVGYAAAISLRIRTSDVAVVSKVIDTALTAGANRVDYVQFGIKEALEAREEAIRLASKAAKRKAGVLAESLDLRLGRVITAGTSTQQSGWWGANRNSNMAQMAGGQEGGGAGDAESVLPGKIEVLAQVDIVFSVNEAK